MAIKCPKCGGKSIAKYLYGLPHFNDKLEKELELGKIVLGGCMVTDFDPKYKCNDCKKDFGFPAKRLYKNKFVDFINDTYYVEFSIGGFFGGYNRTIIQRANDKIIITSTHFMDEETKEISEKDFADILTVLYEKAYILEWKTKYVNEDILDGTQWELKTKVKDVRARNIYGSNDFPPNFKIVEKVFEKYYLPTFSEYYK